MAREAGRDPASIEITLFGLGEDLDRVKRLAEMGVTRVVPMCPPEKAEHGLAFPATIEFGGPGGNSTGPCFQYGLKLCPARNENVC
jgi:hypothetical protein